MLGLPRNELCARNSFRIRCDSGQMWGKSSKCVYFVVVVVVVTAVSKFKINIYSNKQRTELNVIKLLMMMIF